jgi:hypothetical protein
LSLLSSPYQTPKEQQYYRAGGGNANRAEIKLPGDDGAPPEKAGTEPATDECSNDPEKDRDDTT